METSPSTQWEIALAVHRKVLCEDEGSADEIESGHDTDDSDGDIDRGRRWRWGPRVDHPLDLHRGLGRQQQ